LRRFAFVVYTLGPTRSGKIKKSAVGTHRSRPLSPFLCTGQCCVVRRIHNCGDQQQQAGCSTRRDQQVVLELSKPPQSRREFLFAYNGRRVARTSLLLLLLLLLPLLLLLLLLLSRLLRSSHFNCCSNSEFDYSPLLGCVARLFLLRSHVVIITCSP
jgi:hypothetical protein